MSDTHPADDTMFGAWAALRVALWKAARAAIGFFYWPAVDGHNRAILAQLELRQEFIDDDEPPAPPSPVNPAWERLNQDERGQG